jgi:transposase
MSIRKFNAQFKGAVALEAIRERETLAEISTKFEVHVSQVKHWKSLAINGLSGLFKEGNKPEINSNLRLIEELEKKVGQLTMENDFLKKSYTNYQAKRGCK